MNHSEARKYKTSERHVSRIMYRLFVGPFYRRHAGTFLFLYVLFLGSFLFINYLGKMPASESFFWHFILMIFLVTHQFMVVLFLVLSGFYLIKTRYFVKRLLEQYQFVFLKQSLAVFQKKKVWWLWFKVELWLSLPLIIYGLACLGMAIYKGSPVYGIVIMVFLLVFIVTVTMLHYRQLIRLPRQRRCYPIKSKGRLTWSRTAWAGIVFAVTRQLPAVLITKTVSLLFTLLMIHWSGAEQMNLRQWWLSFLLIGTIHALIVFRIANFMEERTKSFWGLPLTELRVFFISVGRSYLFLLIPECLTLLLAGYFQLALLGILTEFCILVFYHYFSAYLQFNLKFLLKSGFLILCLAFVLTLYGLFWLAVLSYLGIGYFIYRGRYYCRG